MSAPQLSIRQGRALDGYVEETMKAVQWEGKPYHVSVRSVPRPTIQKPNDVIVRITTAGICGSDLHTYHGLAGGSNVPFTIGHEAVGIVSEVGDGVTDYKTGDRVVVLGGRFEGTIDELFGFGNLYGVDMGGCQAEYVRVADPALLLVKLPPGLGKELDFLTLSDILSTAWGSVTGSGFNAGDTLMVYGAGPVGLLAAYTALFRGARKVYVVDHVSSRLHKATELGAIAIDLRNGLPSTQVLQFEPSGVDRICDCCGFECVNVDLQPEESFIVNDAIRAVAAHGGIYLTGVYYGAQPDAGQPRITPARGVIPFDIGEWWTKGVTIKGGAVDPEYEPTLLGLVESGRLTPGVVVDKIVRIEDAPEAYRLFDEHKVQKVAIQFFP